MYSYVYYLYMYMCIFVHELHLLYRKDLTTERAVGQHSITLYTVNCTCTCTCLVIQLNSGQYIVLYTS